jgi:hypothetical protein
MRPLIFPTLRRSILLQTAMHDYIVLTGILCYRARMA